MTDTQTRGRLVFQYDLSDPKSVYDFPASFAEFLARYSTMEDVEAFLSVLDKYVKSVGEEDLNFATIANIAAQFADIEDLSGTPFDENEYLTVPGAQTAEEVLEELDSNRDTPIEVPPAFPEVEVEVQAEDDVPLVVYRAIVALRKNGYPRAAHYLARDARKLLRTRPLLMEMLHLVESYVFVDYSLAIEHNERQRRRERRT